MGLARAASWGLVVLMTLNEPSLVENAIGADVQFGSPIRAMSVLPSWLKSPVNVFAVVLVAQNAKFPIPTPPPPSTLVTLKLPSPLENAIGIVCQLVSPASPISVLPSWLKSPVNVFAAVLVAQNAKFPIPTPPPPSTLVTLKLP